MLNSDPMANEERKEWAEFLRGLGQAFEFEERIDGRLKIDFDTAFEDFFTYFTGVGFLALIVEIIIFFTHGWNLFTENLAISLFPVTTIALGLVLLSNTDFYYLLDVHRRELYIERNFFSYHSVEKVCDFDDIYAFSVQGSFERSKHDKWWEYYAVIILGSGKLIRFSDSTKKYRRVQRDLKALVEKLGMRYIDCVPEKRFRVEFEDGELKIIHGAQRTDWHSWFIIMSAIGFWAFAGLAMFFGYIS